ncbi:hypothetical protein [Tenacibaculum bernardetii]|uniref:hypothetical protein n=1 Tax=Tenacibaculum bernardetii TaxID=3021375 RepID=UPI0023B051F6|nr:hypothetical protein [Tenacibaculum bernardetii]
MTAQNLNDKINLKNTELRMTDDSAKRQKLQNDIRVLQYRKEIEVIKEKIRLLS